MGPMENSVGIEASRMERNSGSKITHAAECGWCSLFSHSSLGGIAAPELSHITSASQREMNIRRCGKLWKSPG